MTRYTIANLRQSLASDHGAQLVADALNDGDEAEAGRLLALGAPGGPADPLSVAVALLARAELACTALSTTPPTPRALSATPLAESRLGGRDFPSTQEGLLMMVVELARTVK